MRSVVELSDKQEARGQGIVCASPDTEGPPAAEVRGLPLLELASSPGLFVVTLHRQTNLGQGVRDHQLEQLEFFTQQGYFTAHDVIQETIMGPVPAREFRLTWEGYVLTTGSSSSRPCFIAGQIVFDNLVSFSKSPEPEAGFQFYDVIYRYQIQTHCKVGPKWSAAGPVSASG